MQLPATNGFTSQAVRVVYVIDDDVDMRRSLHFLLETRGICVSPFASGVEFLAELGNLSPAPILLDIRMPRVDGIEVLSQLAERGNNWPVIVISGHGEISTAVKALKLGAIDFLEKPTRTSELMEAIERAFTHLVARSQVDQHEQEVAKRFLALTPREAEVVELLCRGRSNKQVAFDLSISPRTVEMHRANALRQLNVRTLVEAVALWKQL